LYTWPASWLCLFVDEDPKPDSDTQDVALPVKDRVAEGHMALPGFVTLILCTPEITWMTISDSSPPNKTQPFMTVACL